MQDDIEKAQAFSDAVLADEISDAKKHLEQSPKAIGLCLNCEEPLDEGERFCDADCAEDAEKWGTFDGGFIPVANHIRIKRGQMPQYLIK